MNKISLPRRGRFIALGPIGLVVAAALLVLLPRKRGVEDVVEQVGPGAVERLLPHFERAGVAFPSQSAVLLVMKQERELELWAKGDGAPVYIRTYPILGASGGPGPKLREGDRQVPEGFYAIVGLNPNSAFHLSMKLDYPNELDRTHAQADGRDKPGSDIFVHGSNASIGCLAMGDPAIEELFTLTQAIGMENVSVIIAPWDPRRRPLRATESMPGWTADLYREIGEAFRGYARPVTAESWRRP